MSGGSRNILGWLPLGDVGAAAGHDLDQALGGEHPYRLASVSRATSYRCMSWLSRWHRAAGTHRPSQPAAKMASLQGARRAD